MTMAGIQMEGWLNAYSEGGWLPSWSAPGDRGSMTGNMQDASIADAIVKRKWLPTDLFNTTLAWEAGKFTSSLAVVLVT